MHHRIEGERRVRSGCWKCRERRVKCPEQRPICGHCQRLGLACGYNVRLTWQNPTSGHQKGDPTHSHTNPGRRKNLHVCDWMFLNAAFHDFEDSASGGLDDLAGLDSASVPNLQQTRGPACRLPGLVDSSPGPTRLSSMRLSARQARLWDYFVNFITPQCAVKLAANPYRSIVLRIAAASPGGPLFQCVMAVAASQMHSLSHGEHHTSSWEFRALALKSLRCHLDATQHGPEEAIATIVMLSFLEILEECSPSWIVHADFGEVLLASHQTLMVTYPELYHFLAAWLIVHNVLASTAWKPRSGRMEKTTLLASVDESYVQTLTGCPKSLFCLLADITALADPEVPGFPSSDDSEVLAMEKVVRADAQAATKKKRDRMERQLSLVSPKSTVDLALAENEIHAISELKRLATLMYLYARIDESSPYEPHMARLTENILEILPHIPLRTNTILWPLFILATFGVRPESDEHRKTVLQMLDVLQRTRQLGCVKQARRVIEDVWKARDLKTANSLKGWSILEGRHRNISLA